jgi:hypothetical protein
MRAQRIIGLTVAALCAVATVTLSAPAAQAAPAPSGATFTPMTPLRVLDTREAIGPLGPDGVYTLDLSAKVPAAAVSVMLNLTGTDTTGPTYVTAYPSGMTRPNASNLNLVAGETRPNLVTVALGTGRKIDLYNFRNSVNLIADLAGYYAPGAGSRFTPLPPRRVLDTRPGSVGSNATVTLNLADAVPPSATAVTFNLTATETTGPTYVTAYPSGVARPNASNLNLVAGDTWPNLVTVALGADRKVDLYNFRNSVALIADLAGFYTPEYGAEFVPIAPRRILDTRDSAPIGNGATLPTNLNGVVPPEALAVVANLTGVLPTAPTFVSAFPGTRWDNTSNLNVVPGQVVPNLATTILGSDGTISYFNLAGSINLVVDLAGYFVVPPADCAVRCVHGWGANSRGQLGTGKRVFGSPAISALPGLGDVRSVVAGPGTTYAIRTDGTVRAWGNNTAGQLGNGWTGGYSTVAVPVGIDNVVALAASSEAALAVRTDGTVWGWGLAGGTPSSAPRKITGLAGIVSITMGSGSRPILLRSDGQVLIWDMPGGTMELRPGPNGVTAISGQYALRTDGTVWKWDGDTAPAQVAGLTGITAISDRGGISAMALRNDGTVWTWGLNYFGALGHGTLCTSDTPCPPQAPAPVTGLSGVTSISSFQFGGYAIRNDGTVWGWGRNLSDELATSGAGNYSATPVRLTGAPAAGVITGGEVSGWLVTP